MGLRHGHRVSVRAATRQNCLRDPETILPVEAPRPMVDRGRWWARLWARPNRVKVRGLDRGTFSPMDRRPQNRARISSRAAAYAPRGRGWADLPLSADLGADIPTA